MQSAIAIHRFEIKVCYKNWSCIDPKQELLPQVPELAENHWQQVSCPRPKRKKNSICEPKVYGHFNITHLSMVCPRMGGLDNPGELDFVKRTWVGILTSTTIPGVGHLTWPPPWKVERIWEWVTSGAPSWTYPKFMWASFPCPRIQYCVALF